MDLSTLKLVELATIIFGVLCISISIALSLRFGVVNHKLSRALAWQLLAESFIGCITVLFAITSWLGLYKALEPEMVVTLRILIFTTATVSSINLYRRVKELEKE